MLAFLASVDVMSGVMAAGSISSTGFGSAVAAWPEAGKMFVRGRRLDPAMPR